MRRNRYKYYSGGTRTTPTHQSGVLIAGLLFRRAPKEKKKLEGIEGSVVPWPLFHGPWAWKLLLACSMLNWKSQA